ncbi:DUF3558 family protein [Nocardia sp. NPDC003963]
MNLTKKLRGVCLATGVALCTTGCVVPASELEPAEPPTPTSTIIPEPAWLPCALSDAALSGTDLNSKTGDHFLDYEDIQACSWESDPPGYRVVVISTGYTYDDTYSRRSEAGPVTPLSICTRRAFEQPGTRGGCDTIVEISAGSATTFKPILRSPIDPAEGCARIRRHAADLEKYFPSS